LADGEQRGGLPSERPLDGGASRSHEGPSEEDTRDAPPSDTQPGRKRDLTPVPDS